MQWSIPYIFFRGGRSKKENKTLLVSLLVLMGTLQSGHRFKHKVKKTTSEMDNKI